MYDYREAMTSDILDYIHENYTPDEIREAMEDRDTFAETLNDDLWTVDSVTGNASGSYTFNTWTAKEYVTDNTDELREALREFCTDAETISEKFLDEEWEYFDVTIRCYLLGECIEKALDELAEEFLPDEASRAFDEFCIKHHGCTECPFFNLATVDDCKTAFKQMHDND